MRLMIFAALLLAAGCGNKSEPAHGPGGEPAATESSTRKDQDPRVFYRSLGEPEYLDPNKITESEGGDITNDTFEGLYQYGPSETEWLPGVAQSHTLSDDGRIYTFTLRQNAKWSDGTPVTAHDFEYSWKRVLDPETGSRYSSIMWGIEGARAFSTSSAEDRDATRDAVGVKALDDYTLEVRLVGRTPYFKQLTAFYTFAPVPRHVIEKHGDRWARPENIVSNGMWSTKSWVSRQRIVIERNPHYWDQAAIPFDKVVFIITQDNDPAHNMYLSGEIDYLSSKVPPAMAPKYLKERFPELKTTHYLGVYYYMFNVTQPPLDDVRVRQALNMAIDKTQIGKYVVKQGQTAAYNITHPGLASTGYVAPKGEAFNLAKARKLLAEAGYPGGKGFPRVKISYNTMEGHKLVAAYIQQQWRRNLGVDVDLSNMEWKVLLKKQHAKEYQISRMAWIGDYVDPMTFLDLWESENSNNRTGWGNPEYDALIKAVRVEGDPEKRMRLLAQAETIFNRELPGLPIYFYVKHDMVKPWVKGYQPHLQGVHPSRFFRVEL